jgi:voltage-gated potassium channel Kch
MRIAPGKVVRGRVELDAELREGASVIVLTPDADETFEVDSATEKMLLDSIADAQDGRVSPLTEVLDEMRSREVC